MRINKIFKPKSQGFTLVEMLIVAPIVILVIGIFVSTIVNMTGSVMSSRGANALAYNIQNALKSIDSDTRISGGYLSSNSITLQTGQGYDDGTAAFDNVSSSSGDMLILNSYATTSNPLNSSRDYIFTKDQPNACGSPMENQNPKVMTNIIYFVKNNTLWRRVVMPAGYATVGCDNPWQKPTCAPGYSAAFCKTHDTRLVDGVSTSGFDIKYYTKTDQNNEVVNASNSNLTDTVRQTALNTASSVNVTISASGTIAGREISRTGQIRTFSPNDNTTSQIITSQPSNQTANSGSNANFTSTSSGAGATVQWQQSTDNGATWSNVGGATSTTLTLSAVTNTMDGYQYRAIFTTGLDTVTSSSARLTVNLLAWSSFTMQNGWTDYGAPYQTNGYRKTSSGVVTLKGLIKDTNGAVQNEVIGVLPPTYRPSEQLMFLAISTVAYPSRIDVFPNGEIRYVTGNTGWFSLDNIHFVADNGKYNSIPITSFANNWRNYENGWAPATYVVDNAGRVHTQGLVAMGNMYNNVRIFDIPSNLLPSGYMHMPTYVGGVTIGVGNGFGGFGIDNGSAGNSGYVGKGMGIFFLSVNGMYYPSSYSGSWKNLTMANSWAWYSFSGIYSTPQYTKSDDGLVSLKGLIYNGTTTADTIMATLPAGYRPASRIVYAGYSNGAISRVDIDASGNILFEVGSSAWLSLDGITFYADQ